MIALVNVISGLQKCVLKTTLAATGSYIGKEPPIVVVQSGVLLTFARSLCAPRMMLTAAGRDEANFIVHDGLGLNRVLDKIEVKARDCIVVVVSQGDGRTTNASQLVSKGFEECFGRRFLRRKWGRHFAWVRFRRWIVVQAGLLMYKKQTIHTLVVTVPVEVYRRE